MSALLTFGVGQFFVLGDFPMYCGMCSSLGLCELNASNISIVMPKMPPGIVKCSLGENIENYAVRLY